MENYNIVMKELVQYFDNIYEVEKNNIAKKTNDDNVNTDSDKEYLKKFKKTS